MKSLLTILMAGLSLATVAQPSAIVHFNTAAHQLLPDAQATLDSLLLQTPPGAQWKLAGHCDARASNQYNDALSVKRVNAVQDYLLQHGIAATAIVSSKGYGKRQPLVIGTNPQQLALNRRVEITTLLMNEQPATPSEIIETSTAPSTDITRFVEDTAAKSGSSLTLHNLNFYGGSHVILPESLPLLIELAAALKAHPSVNIAVEGHVCCIDGPGDGYDIGTRTKNLSENRAWEICQFLVKYGVAANRLQYKGFGHTKPLYSYPEKSEQEKSLNRRVELKIISR